MVEEFVGKKFGMWEVIEPPSKDKSGHKVVLCRCECGLEKHVRTYSLIYSVSTQCKDCSRRMYKI